MASSPEQRNDLHQQQGKADNEGKGHAGWRTEWESKFALGEMKVEDGIDQTDREEEANQHAIERARLQPPDPAPPTGARIHAHKRSDVCSAANHPSE